MHIKGFSISELIICYQYTYMYIIFKIEGRLDMAIDTFRAQRDKTKIGMAVSK